MKTVKITHIVSSADIYGKEKWILSLLRYIDGRRFHHAVTVLVPAERCPFADHLAAAGVDHRELVTPSGFAGGSIAEIRHILDEDGTAIVHTHDYKADILGYLATRGSHVKRLGTPHGWCGTGDPKVAFYELVDRFFLRRFDIVAPLSPRMAETLRPVNAKRIAVVNNFVDLNELPEPGESDPALVTYLGRLVRLKRVEDAILSLAHTAHTEVRLQIIGDGPLRPALEAVADHAGVSDRVTFHGFRTDRLDLLNASSMLVIPSLTEGISRAAMEAMGMRKAVIGTDVQGIRELITDGESGCLVGTRSPRGIAAAIDSLIDDRDGAAAMGKKARATIERDFSASRAAREYEALYDRLIG